MKKIYLLTTALVILTITPKILTGAARLGEATSAEMIIELPEVEYDSDFSIEKSLLKRRSIRRYKDEPLKVSEVSQLLWAAQGITNNRGLRTAPSAGALYPLEVYVIVGNVHELQPGIYKYKPQEHEIHMLMEGDRRKDICNASLGQSCVEDGAIIIIFSAVYERTTRKYQERGIRYVYMEVGHAAQNVYLQAESLNLGTVVVGAFHDDEMKRIMNMPDEENPLYIMPVGRK